VVLRGRAFGGPSAGIRQGNEDVPHAAEDVLGQSVRVDEAFDRNLSL
jgi:hypothetical protein